MSLSVLVLLSVCLTGVASLGRAGGWSPLVTVNLDPSNSIYGVVQFAVDEINSWYAAQGDNNVRYLKNVASAKSQIVAGVKYNFVLNLDDGSQCDVTVVHAAWETPMYTLVPPITCKQV
ncbi:uncharacterized protein LOC131953416 [Physella acuta]|uniref:uncharacterized protein LOC131953416 n=1 Tax=Physella acuta TaxID=109671 RepID=UPI0027DD0818|nr:uncharacterized protein LOC131953416 [Physella acuta]